MTDSADSPRTGPDTDNATGTSTAATTPAETAATGSGQSQVEADRLSLSFETRYPGRTSFDRQAEMPKFDMPAIDAHDDEHDGPVIRRIRVASRPELALDTAIGTAAANSTPRLFARQLDNQASGHQAVPPAPSKAARNPAPAFDEWYDARTEAGPGNAAGNIDFSVAAIRAKRMRHPAGTHKPTSLATKATVFSLASVCLVAAGVSLGLYGQDMKHHIERQVQLASASVQNVWTRLADSSTAALEPLPQGIGVQANAGGGGDLTTGSATPAAELPSTRRKLIYERLPGAAQAAAGSQQVQPIQAVQPVQPAQSVQQPALTATQPAAPKANGDTLSQLLATPSDFATVQPD
jgi:hypothetical protein